MEDRSMFFFEARESDSSYVDGIWHTHSAAGGEFISIAESHWGMVFTRQNGKVTVTVRGPETKASTAPIPANAEFFGINFKLGTFMPHLGASNLVDNGVNLPDAGSQSFYLHGGAWEIPDFENADTFVAKLVHEGLLVREPMILAVMQGHLQPLSVRSVRRRFLQATGLTHGMIFQIERAQRAMALLRQGVSILDTVEQAGYFDQPHLTKSLKRLFGQTPAQVSRKNR
jgi:AraC-like DNA-binding protein